MKRSKFSEQQIAFILQQAEQGTSVEEVCRKAGISQQTYYRWRKRYGGLMPSEMRRLKQLEEENQRLKRLVADGSLDKAMLQGVVRKNSEAGAAAGAGGRAPADLAGERATGLCGSAGVPLELPLPVPPSVAGRLEPAHPGDRPDPRALRLSPDPRSAAARGLERVNAKRVYRLYTEEGLPLRHKTPKRKVSAKLRKDRSPAPAPNDVWAMDFSRIRCSTVGGSAS